jgi:L-arabinokinase
VIVFYVSGHGFGHATRTGAVIAEIRRIGSQVPVAVRTQAPKWAFPQDVNYCPVQVDFEIVEQPDALSLDVELTRAAVRRFVDELDGIVRKEVAWLRAHGARLLVADIPFLAGLLSRETSLPAIGLGNFTWHWILEPVLPRDPALSVIAEAYRCFTAVFRLPLSSAEGWSEFRTCIDVPLVTPVGSKRHRDEIRRQLGLTSDDRPTVLVAGRSELAGTTVARAAIDSPDVDFLVKTQMVDRVPPNVHCYSEPAVSFSDALRASSVVLSKLGYSTAAECIAEHKRLLYPERVDFREHELLSQAVGKRIPAGSISREKFFSGEWKNDLAEIVRLPFPSPASHGSAGAAVCANLLLEYL